MNMEISNAKFINTNARLDREGERNREHNVVDYSRRFKEPFPMFMVSDPIIVTRQNINDAELDEDIQINPNSVFQLRDFVPDILPYSCTQLYSRVLKEVTLIKKLECI